MRRECSEQGARVQLLEDAKDESSKYGVIEAVCAPKPPPSVSANAGSRVYIMFKDPDGAAKARAVFHGRQFDGNEISATYVGDDEFARAAGGQWVLSSGPGPSLPPPPGTARAGTTAPCSRAASACLAVISPSPGCSVWVLVQPMSLELASASSEKPISCHKVQRHTLPCRPSGSRQAAGSIRQLRPRC